MRTAADFFDALKQVERQPAVLPGDLSDESDWQQLREALLQAQYAQLNAEKRHVTLLLIGGLDGMGKGQAINHLQRWLDPRHIRVMAFGEPAAEAAVRPPLWRYWSALPQPGQLGVVFGSWYHPLQQMLLRRRKHIDESTVTTMVADIRAFEAMLASDGVRVIKLWFHLSRDEHAERLERLASNPATAWQVSPADYTAQKRFKPLRRLAAAVMAATDAPHAPWHILSGEEEEIGTRRLAQLLLDSWQQPVARPPAVTLEAPPPVLPAVVPEPHPGGAYDKALLHWQGRLAAAVHTLKTQGRSLALAFEGQDAAGKGGVIRRLVSAFDVRQYSVYPISAPTERERERPYLWRFWRRVPAEGRIAVFDRSWYGRVLVERVERFASRADWQRAYDEINAFERQWADAGVLVLKIWLDVSKPEQLRRFREREASPLKRYKITEDDWRNRKRWASYARARDEMLARTHTPHAPWLRVLSDDKRAARIAVLAHVALSLEQALGESPDDRRSS